MRKAVYSAYVCIQPLCYNLVMKNSIGTLSRGAISLVLFALSVVFLLFLTLFESSFVNLSLNSERIISAVFLVLPGVIGVLFGISSLMRKEDKRWMAFAGILLNSLFALFHIFLLGFAG